MSYIEIVSLIVVVLSVALVIDAVIRSNKYKKVKSADLYRKIKIGFYLTAIMAPSFIYNMCIIPDELFKSAILFLLVCDVIVLLRYAPIVLKEEMKKLP